MRPAIVGLLLKMELLKVEVAFGDAVLSHRHTCSCGAGAGGECPGFLRIHHLSKLVRDMVVLLVGAKAAASIAADQARA